MAAMVLLLHETPDGGSHFDWLIARDEAGPLVSFRVAERVDLPSSEGAMEVRAARAPDHRREYLKREGPLSGGRGRVTRVASGQASIETDRAEEIAFSARWDGAERGVCVRGAPRAEGGWVLEIRGEAP